jgi:hypothetical protein
MKNWYVLVAVCLSVMSLKSFATEPNSISTQLKSATFLVSSDGPFTTLEAACQEARKLGTDTAKGGSIENESQRQILFLTF